MVVRDSNWQRYGHQVVYCHTGFGIEDTSVVAAVNPIVPVTVAASFPPIGADTLVPACNGTCLVEKPITALAEHIEICKKAKANTVLRTTVLNPFRGLHEGTAIVVGSGFLRDTSGGCLSWSSLSYIACKNRSRNLEVVYNHGINR